jgi:hypothetical protein
MKNFLRLSHLYYAQNKKRKFAQPIKLCLIFFFSIGTQVEAEHVLNRLWIGQAEKSDSGNYSCTIPGYEKTNFPRARVRVHVMDGKLSLVTVQRECVSTGAASAQTRRSLGHHLLDPLILRILVLCAPAAPMLTHSL